MGDRPADHNLERLTGLLAASAPRAKLLPVAHKPPRRAMQDLPRYNTTSPCKSAAAFERR